MLGVILFAAALLSALVSLTIGPAQLGLGETAAALLGRGDETARVIVWELRLPRTLLALMIGATLAMAGAVLQGYVRNPLASPDLLGASGFAALGAVLVLHFGAAHVYSLAVPAAAIAMALLSAGALLLIAGQDSRVLTLVLAGLALASLAGALTALALSLASNPFAVMEIAFWLLGSLADRSFEHVRLAAPFLIASWLLLLYDRRALLALTLGEDTARALGVALNRVRIRLMLAIALGVGAAVAVAGVIGFAGLVVPHLLRPLTGYDPARLVLPSGLAGAALLTAADCATRLIPATAELKLGVFTSLLGVPFFLFLIFKERRGRPAFL